jgi:hypothetical protein
MHATMPLADSYYTLFENRFLKAKGDALQTFFEDLMGRAFPGDFMPCRPWGNEGDRKNDGFLQSQRRLFQVYAPNEMKKAVAEAKIKEDFAGALQHWRVHFDHWTFVHNAHDGLRPHVQQVILDTQRANPGVTIETWSLHELAAIFRQLSDADLVSWFGRLSLQGNPIPFQLPPAAASYIGRAEKRADLVRRLMEQTRTDVFAGPGMGKTALAAAALSDILPSDPALGPWPDGIVFINIYLHKLDFPSAWHAVADALDPYIPADQPAEDRARAACSPAA